MMLKVIYSIKNDNNIDYIILAVMVVKMMIIIIKYYLLIKRCW
jgi:hypothetical protein